MGSPVPCVIGPGNTLAEQDAPFPHARDLPLSQTHDRRPCRAPRLDVRRLHAPSDRRPERRMSDDSIRTHFTTQLEDFMREKVWFITGCSRGFGRVWAEAALERGDKVVATARDVGSLGGLAAAHPDTCLAVPVDVTDR